MKKVVLDEEEFEALVRRNEELNVETLDLYGGKSEVDYLHKEQSSGWVPAVLATISLITLVYCVFGLVRWLVQGSAS